MTKEIKELENVSVESKQRRLFVLKDDKGRYYSTCSRHHWTDDINYAQLRAKVESVEADAKNLMRYKKEGQVPHLTTFEKLYVQEVEITEVTELKK